MIYFTSDLHLGHAGIIPACLRPFRDVKDMNETLIANYNAIVGKNDTVYILGDLSYKVPVEAIPNLLARLKGTKILIRGNHDNRSCDDLYKYVKDFERITVEGMDLTLMHYPMLSWPNRRRGAVHLHGHIHASYEYNETNRDLGIRRFDVGIDANNFFPVSAKQIREFFALDDPTTIERIRDWMDE